MKKIIILLSGILILLTVEAQEKGKNKYDFGTSTSQIQHEKEMTGSLLKYTDLSPSRNEVPS